MRVSFEPGVDSTWLWAGSGGLKRNRQQPGPNGVGIFVSLMHCPSGKSPGFWFAFGGNTYVSLLISLLPSTSDGLALFRDDVFESDQSAILFAVPVGLPVSEPSPAIELRKNSV